MKTLFLFVIALFSLTATAQSLPARPTVSGNLLADPFAALQKLEQQASPPTASAPPASPKVVVSEGRAPVKPLPAGLRVILIRNKGQGLLASNEAGSYSIAVSHGQPVRIAEQNYQAEVSPTQIKLYATPKGKLIWQGALVGVLAPTLQADASALKYTPPLSAGVSPGLGSSVQSTTQIGMP